MYFFSLCTCVLAHRETGSELIVGLPPVLFNMASSCIWQLNVAFRIEQMVFVPYLIIYMYI